MTPPSRMYFAIPVAGSHDRSGALLDGIAYAVVLADLRLGGTGGSEGLRLARRIRERDPATRIVILTAYGSPSCSGVSLRRSPVASRCTRRTWHD